MRYMRITALMAFQYALLVFNMRMVAAGSYAGTISSDAVIAFNGLVLTKFAVAANTWGEKGAYVVGGCIGSAMALWLTIR